MKKQAEIRITGNVQDVCYRINTVEKAKYLKITGYVKNEPDGSVIIIAEGEEEKLKCLAQWCEDGVKSANVKQVQVDFSQVTGEFSDFNIKH
ncbi:acylphosphatase [Patescibacteria group bacterium]|nr:acylphosphatase [Patescibacteria group bacterium]